MRHILRDAKDSLGFYQECMHCGLMVPRGDLKGLKEFREKQLIKPCKNDTIKPKIIKNRVIH